MMTQKITWVNVVDADGNQIDGFANPVPSSWIGTDLLPEGAKKAPKVEESEEDATEIDAKVAAAEQRATDAEAKVAELQAKVDELEKAVADAKAPATPSRSK